MADNAAHEEKVVQRFSRDGFSEILTLFGHSTDCALARAAYISYRYVNNGTSAQELVATLNRLVRQAGFWPVEDEEKLKYPLLLPPGLREISDEILIVEKRDPIVILGFVVTRIGVKVVAQTTEPQQSACRFARWAHESDAEFYDERQRREAMEAKRKEG